MIVQDYELQAFASEMHGLFTRTRTNKEDFGIPQKFTTRHELITFLGNLMFTIVVQHSILNYADLEFHGQVYFSYGPIF